MDNRNRPVAIGHLSDSDKLIHKGINVTLDHKAMYVLKESEIHARHCTHCIFTSCDNVAVSDF